MMKRTMSQNVFRILALIYLLPASGLFGQQDAHYTQYMFNGLAINPAYAGSRGTIASTLYFRKQWWGMIGSPTTQSFGIHAPDKSGRYGFGLSATNDQLGYISQQWLNLSYAYRVAFDGFELSMGLQGGFLNYGINWTRAIVYEAGDPNIPLNAQNIFAPNIGTGFLLHGERFYLGFSVPHLLNSNLRRTAVTGSDIARVYRHYFFTAGYVFGLGPLVKARPACLLKYVKGGPPELDLNFSLLFADKLWAGLSYRSFDALAVLVEYNVIPQIRIGYAFDFTLTPLRQYNSGTHELFLGYEFLFEEKKVKSPRYF